MKKIILSLAVTCLLSIPGLFPQSVGINTDGSPPHPSAILDIKSSSKGLLIPRMTTAQRNAIISPAKGLMVFDTDNNSFEFYTGTVWTVVPAASSVWTLTGNSGTTPASHFIGTTDSQGLLFKINNEKAGLLGTNGNAFWGLHSGYNTSTGINNVAIGIAALKNNTDRGSLVAIGDSTLYNNGTGTVNSNEAIANTAVGSKVLLLNTTGAYNTGNGFRALRNNTIGYDNTAIGAISLYYNTTGNVNTAIGTGVLFSNTTGGGNTAAGAYAMNFNTTGEANVAIGNAALYFNTTGSINTAVGNAALYNNTTGISNTAIGDIALRSNTTGNNNTAGGKSALQANTTGNNNTATGSYALFSNITGNTNTATGHSALRNNTTGSYNTADGSSALQSNITGEGNTADGYFALQANTTGNYNTANGNNALYSNLDGNANTATGSNALNANTAGDNNTANGLSALSLNTTGMDNTATGTAALLVNSTGNRNTCIGTLSLFYNTTGNDNIAVGHNAGTSPGTFNNTVSIGNDGILNGFHNQAFIGNLSTGWIGGNVGWSTFSDARMKVNMSDDVKGLDFITRLNPVTYYRKIKAIADITGDKPTKDFPEKYDIEKIKFSGFLAQEVEQAAKDAGYDFNGVTRPKKHGDLYSLSYESFVVPLVKAVQEQQKIIEQQNKLIQQQQQQYEALLRRVALLENKN